VNIGIKIGLGFGLAIAILFGVGFVTHSNTEELIEHSHRVTHTYRVLERLEGVFLAVQDQETRS
jgi:CHASE3 domain sensor protein